MKSNEGFFGVLGGHDKCKMRDVLWTNPHFHVSVCKIHFGEENVSLLWIRAKDVIQEAWEYLAKLHGICWGLPESCHIDTSPRVISNQSGAAALLWN